MRKKRAAKRERAKRLAPKSVKAVIPGSDACEATENCGCNPETSAAEFVNPA